MATGRPPYGFVLIDLPSDHEIENGIVRECQVIAAILHNRAFGTVTKTFTATSVENFKSAGWRSYPGTGFVHLSTHGGKTGIGLIGGDLRWAHVADKLKTVAPQLAKNQRRVLCLSCCYSETGIGRLKPLLKGHFTHAYYFAAKKISFATAMTVWSMFYRKKSLEQPLKAVVDPINRFFGTETIAFDEL